MKVHPYQSLQLPESVLAVGAFDGVHKGHQKLIESARQQASILGVPLVVYTFDPPPRVHFQQAMQLTTVEEKVERLAKMGVDHVIVAPFDSVYAARAAEQFYEEIEQIHPNGIWVGTDFRFGAGRQGDIHSLRERFHVHTLEPVCCAKGEVISSTRIRKLMMANMQLKAEQLLGWHDGSESQMAGRNTKEERMYAH